MTPKGLPAYKSLIDKAVSQGDAVYVTGPVTRDKYLEACYDNKSYPVILDCQGGTINGQALITKYVQGEHEYGPLDIPIKQGHTYGGWWTSPNGTGTQVHSSLVAGLVPASTIYAKWTPSTYTVSFDAQNGSVSPTSKTVTYGSTYGTLPIPIRTGSTFNGWYTAPNGGGVKITDTTTVSITSDQTLYAKWTPISDGTIGTPVCKWEKRSITYSAARQSSGSVGVGFSGPFGTLPVNTGVFYNGYSVSNGIFSYTGAQNYGPTGFYLAWQNGYRYFGNENIMLVITNYTTSLGFWILYYDVYAVTSTISTSCDIVYGPTGTYPENGRQFDSTTNTYYWYSNMGLCKSTVSFNSNGGTPVSTQNVYYGNKVIEPAAPTKTGYTFAGWYSDSGLTKPWNFTTGVADGTNFNLYAKWTPIRYTISFNTNGGSSVTSITQDYNSKITSLPVTEKTGNTFAGWYADAALTIPVSFPYTITGNATLYAKWDVIPYTVFFNTNGGEPAFFIETRNYNTTIGSAPEPTKTGYAFVGWYVDEGLTIPASFPYTVTQNTTLYAKWTGNPYTVTFNSRGGSAVPAASASYGELVPEPAAPVREGYAFTGWYSDIDCQFPWDFAANTVAANITLYAGWTRLEAEFKFASSSYTVRIPSSGASVLTANATGTDAYGNPINSEEITYSFEYPYNGVIIDEQTGVITVTLEAQPGTVYVIARYQDLTCYATLILTDAVTRSMNFISGPYTMTLPSVGNQTLTVEAQVTDNNAYIISDAVIIYSLDAQYTGVSIDRNTGEITITPEAQPGTVNITALYENLRCDATLTLVPQVSYSVNFISEPFTITIPNSGSQTLTVEAQVKDNNAYIISDAVIIYSLDAQYTGVSIDSNTGQITVTPEAQPGIILVIASYQNINCSTNITLTTEPLASDSIDLSVIQNTTFNISFVVRNEARFSGKTFTLTYDDSVLQLTDFSIFTENKETTEGVIAGTSIIVTAFLPGEVEFIVDKAIPDGQLWSGVLNVFEFKALTNGDTVIYVQNSSR